MYMPDGATLTVASDIRNEHTDPRRCCQSCLVGLKSEHSPADAYLAASCLTRPSPPLAGRRQEGDLMGMGLTDPARQGEIEGGSSGPTDRLCIPVRRLDRPYERRDRRIVQES